MARGTLKRCGWVVAAIGAAAVALSAQDAGTVRRMTVQGTELAWVEQGSGTPVVFVHGSGADLRTWGYQMGPVAQASFRAVAYSRRFHHPNAPPAEADAYRAALHAADLAAFIESLHAGAVHIVASSYGGVVALLAARDRPVLIRTLVLTEPAMLSLLPPDSAGGRRDCNASEGAEPHRAGRPGFGTSRVRGCGLRRRRLPVHAHVDAPDAHGQSAGTTP